MPRRKLLGALVAYAFASSTLANPVGPVVVNGSANFATAGKTLTVTNTPNAIINWRAFSIGAGETTRFVQQSATSAVLNRVTGQDPSAILGTLSSNGRVFLLNPNGIVFGAGSRVDVAGLVASTLNLSNQDFLAGKLNFEAGATANSVLNYGNIVTPMGGRVYLIAPNVENHGVISTPQGQTILAAGRTVQLVEADVPNLRVEIQSGGEALNVGQILAEGGAAGIYAGLINQKGTVRADSVSRDAAGNIVFRASGRTTLDTGSVTSANGGTGGRIEITGAEVGLIGNARVEAKGEKGGGTVLVGGDYQGKNPDVPNARATYVGPDAVIDASATASGDGGKVVVWADDVTRFYGNISARGGPQAGNGGFAEVSGKAYLDYQGRADLTASQGKTGLLLLDPSNINITTTSDSFAGGSFGGGVFGSATGTATITWATIDSQLSGSDVAITTSGTGGSGNITVVNAGAYNRANSLSLLGENNVTVNSGATITNSGAGNIKLVAGWDGVSTVTPAVTNGTGTVTVNANVTTGGQISVLGGNGATFAGGTVIVNGSYNSGTGTTTVSGGTLDLASNSVSVNSLTVSGGTLTGSGNIDVSGAFNWTGNSVITGSGTLTTLFGGTTTLAPSFNQTTLLSGSRIWDNYGTVTLTTNATGLSNFQIDDTLTGGTAVFNNKFGGVFNLNGTLNTNHVIGVGTFNNAGILNKNLNVSSGFAPVFNNQSTGLVNVTSGTLALNGIGTDVAGSAYNIDSGTTLRFGASRSVPGSIAGAGTMSFAGGTSTVSGSYNVSGSTQMSGTTTANFTGPVTNVGTSIVANTGTTTLNFGGITSGEGTAFANLASINSTSTLTFKAGTVLSGLTTLTVGGGTLDLANSNLSLATLDVLGGTVTGSGNIDVSGAFNWTGSSVITGSGTLTTLFGGTTALAPSFNQTTALRGSRIWDNYGTVTFTPNGGGLSRFQIDDTLTGGTAEFNNKSGGVFNLNSADDNTHITGVGTFNNAGTLYKNLNFTSSFSPVFNNQSTGVVNVTSGTLALNGIGTDVAGSAYNIDSGTTLRFGASRSVPGSIAGAGTMSFAGGTSTVSGSYNVSGSTQMSGTTTANFTGPVTNVGTSIVANTGTTTLNFGGITSGEGTAFANLASINSTSTLTFKAGTALPALTALTVGGGTLNLADSNLSLTTLDVLGGTLTGSGNINVSGAFNWTGTSVITGSGTLTTLFGGTTTLAPVFNQTTYLAGSRIWNNFGTVNFTPSGGGLSHFQIDDTLTGGTAVFNNKPGALFNINTSNNDTHINGVGTFINEGIVSKNLAGISSFSPVFNNQSTGVVNVTSGTLALNGVGTDVALSAYNIASGTTLQFGSTRTVPGSIAGAGTMSFAGGTATVSGGYNVSGTTQISGTTTANFTGPVTNVGTSIVANSGTTTLNFGGITSGEGTAFANLASINSTSTLTFKAGTALPALTALTVGGGTLDLANSNLSLTTLNVSAGTLTGSGNINVSGAFNWGGSSNSFITGSGTLTTQVGSTATLTPGMARTISLRGSRVWDNYGTVNFTPDAGTLSYFQIDDTLAGGTAVLNNRSGGVFNINASFNDTHISGVGTFNNSGQVNKNLNTSVASSGIAPVFNNQSTGVVNVNSGTFVASGALTQNGTINVATGTVFQKTGGFTNAGKITGAGTVNVGAGNTLVNNGTIAPGGANAVGTLNVTGHLANGAGGVLEIELGGDGGPNDAIVATGNVSGSGTIKANDLAGYQTVSGHTYPIITSSGGSVSIAPAFVSDTGGAYSGAGSPIYTMTATANGAVQNVWNGITNDFWDIGTNWSLGYAPLNTELAVIDAAGVRTVEVRSTGGTQSPRGVLFGSLGGTDNLLISGSATLDVGTTGMSVPASSSLTLFGGTLQGAGTTTVASGAGLTISGSPTLLGITLNNQSTTAQWTGNGTLTLHTGGTLLNNGTLTATGDGTITRFNTGVFTNNGLFEKNGGTGTTTINDSGTTLTNSSTGTIRVTTGTLNLSSTFNNQGLVDVAAGKTLNINGTGAGGGDYVIGSLAQVNLIGGTQTFDTTGGTPSITGAGLFNVNGGTMLLNTALGADNVQLTAGVIDGAGTLTVNGAFNWSAGTLSGAGVLTTNGTTTLTGGTLNGKTWDNYGTVNHSGGNLNLNVSAAVINNKSGANWNESVTSTVFGNAGSATFNNAGTLTLTSGGTSDFTLAFNNTNQVTVSSGTLNLQAGGTDTGTYNVAGALHMSGGTRNLNASSNITGAGTLALNGGATVSVLGGFGIAGTGTLQLNSGTLNLNTGTSVSFANGLTIAGTTLNATDDVVIPSGQTLTWSAGMMSGAGVLTTNGTTTLTGGTLNGKTWDNYGTVNHSGANLSLNFLAAMINNKFGANWNESVTSTVFGNAGGATFNNAGTLTANSGGTSDFTLAFNNQASGAVSITGATTLNQLGALTQAGTLDVGTGATFLKTAGFTNAGTISGAGTVNVGASALINNGTIRPGGAGVVGTLNVSGNYSQGAGGTLDMDVSGAATYDKLVISGAATLAGTLLVTPVSYTPVNGDQYNLLSYSGLPTGTFATITAPAFTGATPDYATSGNFYFNMPVLTTNTWLFDGNDSWLTTARWSLGHIPLNTEDVIVPDYTTQFTVTIPSGTQVAKSIVLQGNDTLAVNGGSLSFTNPSTINSGTLAIGGGTVTANGTLGVGTLNLSSGTLNGTGAVAVASAFNWSGGTLAGAGMLTTGGTTTLTGGTLSGRTWNNFGTVNHSGSDLTMQSGAIINNQAGANYDFQTNVSIQNGGGGPAFNNLASGNVIKSGGGAGFSRIYTVFDNDGTFTHSSSGSTVTLVGGGTHNGTFNLVSGTAGLEFWGGVLHTFTGTSNISGAGIVYLTGTPVTVNGAYSPGTTEVRPGATLTINSGGATTGTLNMIGGTLQGTGALTVNGAFNWSGGTLAGGNTFVTNGISTLSSGTNKVLDGKTWINNGTANLNVGALVLSNGSTLINGSIFNVTTAGSGGLAFLSAGGALVDAIDNSGTFNWNTAGAVTVQGNLDAFANNGVVNVNGGTMRVLPGGTDTGAWNVAAGATLALDGGTRNLNAGTDITGAGALTVTGGTVNVLGNLGIAATGTVSVSSGTLDINTGAGVAFANTLTLSGGTLTAADDLTTNGAFNWSGGTLTGAGLFTTGAASVSTLSTGANKVLDAKTWINDGTANLNTGALTFNNGSTVTNQNIFNVTTAGSGGLAFQSAGGAPVDTISNSGTMNWNTAGAVTVQGNLDAFTNTGIVNVNGGTMRVLSGGTDTGAWNVAGGATLALDSGTRNLSATSDITGAGALTVTGGTVNVLGNLGIAATGTVSVSSGTLDINTVGAGVAFVNMLSLSGGTLTAADNLTANGAFNWSAGTLAGAGTFTTNGSSTLSGGTAKVLDAKTWINNGTAALNTGVLALNNGSTLNNQGSAVFNVTTAGSGGLAFQSTGGAPVDTVTNSATVNWNTPGAVTVQGNLDSFNNTGTVNVNGGSMLVIPGGTDSGAYTASAGATLSFAGGTRDLNAGTSFAGLGTVGITGGTTNFNSNVVIPNAFTHTGGGVVTLGGTGNVTLNGSFTWSGGADIIGSGTLTTNGITTVTNAGNAIAKPWLNNGTVNINADGVLEFAALSSTWTNAVGGIVNLNGTSANPIKTFNAAGHVLNNVGTINKQAGSAATQTIGDANLAITNSGTINVNSGTLQVGQFASNTNSGTINVAAGTTLSTLGSALTNSGVITGSGTLNLTAATLTNDGVVRPGGAGAAGTLNITGNYAQGAGGALDIDIGGTGAGQYDVLAVSGSATLNGALNRSYLSYTPVNDDTFNVLTYGSRSGAFGSGTDANSLALLYGGTSLILLKTSGTANVWTLAAGGDWNTPANWSLTHVPTSSEQALVGDLTGTSTILLTSAAPTTGSIRFLGNDTLTLDTGGALTVAGTTRIDAGGTLSVGRGGIFTTNGAATVSNLAFFSNGVTSGTVNGPGSLTVTNNFTGGYPGIVNIGGNLSMTRPAGDLTVQAEFTAPQISLTAPAGSVVVNFTPLNAGAGGLTLTAGGPTGDVVVADAQVTSSGPISVIARDLKVQSTTYNTTLTGGSQNINVSRDVIVTGGPSSAGIWAFTGAQTITAGRNVTLTAGSGGDATVQSIGGLQTIAAANALSATGGPGGDDRFASVHGAAGQAITAGSIQLAGGNSAGPIGNWAEITQSGVGATQTITVTGGGSLTIQGGTGTNNEAHVENFGTTQSINFPSGGTLTLTNGGGGSGNLAVLSGSGLVSLGGGTLVNNGVIRPGVAGTVGTLNITGNYSQGAGGTLDMDVSGASTYDKLVISGTAMLDGTLLVTPVSYTPVIGDQYNLLTYSGLPTGTFATITAPAFAGATPDYATSGSFFFNMPGSVTNTWNFDGSDSWLTTARWSLGHIPLNTEDVIVPDYTTQFTVTIPSGTQVAKSIVLQGNDILEITGGSFAFTNASTINNGALAIAGGTVTANASLAVKDVTLSSGALNGSGNVNISNALNWSGGTLGGTATVTTGAASTSTLSGGTKTLNGIWQNNGIANWTGGHIDLSAAGAVLRNASGGQFNATTSLTTGDDILGGSGLFLNQAGATFTVAPGSTAGDITMLADFQNDGMVAINSTALDLHRNGVHAGTFTIPSGALRFRDFGSNSFSGPSSISGAGLVEAFNTPSVNINGTYNVGSTTASGGTISFNGATKTTGTLTMAGGTVNGGGGLTVTNAYSSTGGSINLGGSLSITQAAGDLVVNNSLTGNGVSLVATAGSVIASNSSIGGAGGLTLSAGGPTGDVVLTNVSGNNSGGPVNVSGRDLTLLASTGSATLLGASMNVNMTQNISLTGGAAGGAGLTTIGGAQTIAAGNNITLTAAGSGTVGDAGFFGNNGLQTVTAGGILSVAGGAGGDGNSAYIQGGQGQVISAGSIQLASGSGVGPNGNGVEIAQLGAGYAQTINVTGGGTLSLQAGTGNLNKATIENFGTSQTINFPGGGALSLTGGSGGYGNGAQLKTQSGTQSVLGSPAITLLGGGLGGIPNNGNDAIIEGNTAAQTINASSLTLTAGSGVESSAIIATDVSPATITVSGATTLTAGSGSNALAAIGSDAAAVNITLNSAGGVSLQGGTGSGAFALIGTPNGNTANVSVASPGGSLTLVKGAGAGSDAVVGSYGGAGIVQLNANTLNLNNGVVRATSGLTLTSPGAATLGAGGSLVAGGMVSNSALNVQGLLSITSGTANLGFGGTHTGTFSIAPGATLNFSGGGHTLNPGAVIAGAGAVGLTAGSLTLNTPVTATTFNMSGGTLAGAGILNVNGALNYTAGSINGTLDLAGSSNSFLNGVSVAGTGQIDNLGALTLQNVSMAPALINDGALTILSGVNSFASIDNNGLFLVNAGTVSTPAPYLQFGGLTLIQSGAMLNVPAGMVLNGGSLMGNGTVTGNVNNVSGTLAAGGSIGALSVNGNYTQGPGGTMQVEFSGSSSGQYDVFNVTGTASIDGTLALVSLPGAIVVPGSPMGFLSAGSLSGTFATTLQPPLGSFSLAYTPTGIDLSGSLITTPPPVPPPPSQVLPQTQTQSSSLEASESDSQTQPAAAKDTATGTSDGTGTAPEGDTSARKKRVPTCG